MIISLVETAYLILTTQRLAFYPILFFFKSPGLHIKVVSSAWIMSLNILLQTALLLSVFFFPVFRDRK